MKDALSIKTTLKVSIFLSGLLLFCAACHKKETLSPDPDQEDLKRAIILDCAYFSQNTDIVLSDDPESPVDYVISCNAQIKGSFVVDPGVVVVFNQDAGLSLGPESKVKVNGSPELPVVFKGAKNTKGFWRGIVVQSGDDRNLLSHLTIQNAGGKAIQSGLQAGLVIAAAASINLTSCIIRENKNTGLYLSGQANVSLSHNTFTQNDLPMFTTFKQVNVINATNSFSGNVKDVLVLNGGSVSEASVIAKIDIPYQVQLEDGQEGISIEKGRLSIEPGVEIVMKEKASLIIKSEASLKMVGTPEEKIIIRGEQNVPAQWNNIYIQSASIVNEIGYAEIRNGGKASGYPNGAVLVDQSQYLNIHDVTFIKCFEYGISLNLDAANPPLRIAYIHLSLENTPKLFSNWSGSEVNNPFNP